MTYGAQPSDKCSPPPAGIVAWWACCNVETSAPVRQVLIHKHTWMEARAEAMAIFGCEPQQLEVELVK